MKESSPNNAASRLLSIVEQAAPFAHNRRAWEAWAEAFDLPEGSDDETVVEVVRLLGLLRHQVALVRQQMPATGVRAQNYEPALTAVEQAMSVVNLSAAWHAFKERLSAETLARLEWCVDMLPPDSPEWPPEAAMELEKQVQGLIKKVKAAKHPPEVKALLLEHLNSMLRAIRDYPITGSAAVAQSFLEIAGTAVAQPQAYAEGLKSDEGKQTSRLLKRLREFGVGVAIFNSLLDAGIKLKELGGKASQGAGVVVVVGAGEDDTARVQAPPATRRLPSGGNKAR